MKTQLASKPAHMASSISGGWRWSPVHRAGLACAVVYAVLAWFSTQPQLLSPLPFYGLLGSAFALSLLAFRHAEGISPVQLLLWAAAFRLIGCVGEPLLEDDFFRYLWDGYRFFESGSPYGIAPAAYFGDASIPQAFINVLGQINYPYVPSIYGPTLEYSFLLSHLIAPAQVWPLQLLYSLVDLALIGLLLRLADRKWVLLYAWSPLVIKELAYTAHPDGVGVFFLILALYWRREQVFAGAAAALALSVGAKVIAWLLVPFVLWRMPRRYWAVFVLVLAALYVPFLLQHGSDLAGLQVFAQRWQFNGSLYALVSHAFSIPVARWSLGLAFLCCYLLVFVRHCQKPRWEIPRGDQLIGLFFLVSPVVNAWYLLWLLPFAAIYPQWWSWSASMAVLLSYLTGINFQNSLVKLPLLQLPLWVRLLEYGSVAAAGLAEWVMVRRTSLNECRQALKNSASN
ncbi:hypothetical protein [Porticoccus sp.]